MLQMIIVLWERGFAAICVDHECSADVLHGRAGGVGWRRGRGRVLREAISFLARPAAVASYANVLVGSSYSTIVSVTCDRVWMPVAYPPGHGRVQRRQCDERGGAGDDGGPFADAVEPMRDDVPDVIGCGVNVIFVGELHALSVVRRAVLVDSLPGNRRATEALR